MRSGLVKILPPRLDLAPGVVQRQEPVRVEAFIAQPAIEAFHLPPPGGTPSIITRVLLLSIPARLRDRNLVCQRILHPLTSGISLPLSSVGSAPRPHQTPGFCGSPAQTHAQEDRRAHGEWSLGPHRHSHQYLQPRECANYFSSCGYDLD